MTKPERVSTLVLLRHRPESLSLNLMQRAFSSYRGRYPIPAATIDETQISGMGGALAPSLMLPVHLDGRFGAIGPKEAIRFQRMRGSLTLPSGEEIPLRDAHVGLFVSPAYASSDHTVYLQFPLDTGRIEALEKCRNGGDVKLKLLLRMDAEQMQAVAEIPANAPYPATPVWGYVQTHNLELSDDITISRSTWIDRVHQQIGRGIIHLIELPAVPIEQTEAIGKAFTALKQAQAHHRMGNYDDAVGKCRTAMESFWEPVDGPERDSEGRPKRIPKLKSSWETKLGKATFEWLNASLTAMKQPGNSTIHNPDPHYDQFQSQMIQAIVTTLISYAARQQ